MILAILGLVLLAWFLIQTEPVQNWIAQKVTRRLSRELKVEVSVKHVGFSLFNRMNLDNTLIRDRQKDTLLYAAKVKLRITDWFFLKDTIELKYIGLEDAIIKQHRKDSVWNFQFLADYFGSSSSKSANKHPVVLHLHKIDLKNVTYIQNDLWVGVRQVVRTGSLLLDADDIDFQKNRYVINSIHLDNTQFATYDLPGLRPETTRKATPGMYFNDGDLTVSVKKITIDNGEYLNYKPGKADAGFDGLHIDFRQINGDVDDFSFFQDTIKANVSLSSRERSGLVVKKLSAKFRLTPQIMEFSNLLLRTNRSEIRDYYAMHYKDFNGDMNRYIDRVTMEAYFKNAEVSTDDIAFFAPELRNFKKVANLSGRFLGTVADFEMKGLTVATREGDFVSGNLKMRGLPDVDRTTIVLTGGGARSDYESLKAIIPVLRDMHNPDLKTLGSVRFTGEFSGTIHAFKTKGTLDTRLGGVYADIAMQLPSHGEPGYKGILQTNHFDIGRFVHEPLLGTVSFNGAVNGSSFSLPRMSSNINGKVQAIEFNGYTYKNLTIDGTFLKKYFRGEFKADDPNFDFTSTVEVDFTHELPRFNVLGDLVSSNLEKLNFANEHIELTGLFDLNFTGRNIDEFLGSAKILNAILTHESEKLAFDSLVVESSLINGNKTLSARSNEFDVTVFGKFNIRQLPVSLQSFLNKYYPSVIAAPEKVPANQQFEVTLETRQFDKYTRLINHRFSGFDHSVLKGYINTVDTTFTVTADVPSFRYGPYKIEDASIKGRGDLSSLNVNATIRNVTIGDSLRFPNSVINIVSANDHSDVHIATRASNTLNEANLNAEVFTLSDGIRISFKPSSFVVNDKKWTLEDRGEVTISKSVVSAHNVKFTSGFQEIVIDTREEEGSNTNNLVLHLAKVNVGDFTSLVTIHPRIEGVASGDVYLQDFFGKFNADATLRTEQFRLADDSIGVVTLHASYNGATGLIAYKGISDNDKFRFNLDGNYNTNDSLGSPLDVNINLSDNTKIGILNEWLSGVFTNIKGYAKGTLKLRGDFEYPQITGKVSLYNTSLKVNYTQVDYFVDSATLNFGDDFIDLGEISVRDRDNNVGVVSGMIYEKRLKNIRYDVDVTSDKLLVLNTRLKDNQTFYGQAIGKVNMNVSGPQDNLTMTIRGEVADTTHIYIPPINNRQSSDADFIVFKKYGKEINNQVSDQSRLTIDLDLTVNNKAQVDVILDDLSGDVIRGVGHGRLAMHIANGDVTMNGRYIIERGSYDFNFQSFIKKPFILRGGENNFIEWNGDPSNASINIDAQYTAEKVSLNDLLSTTNLAVASNYGSAARAYRGDVYVIANLNGKLSKPNINFRLDFPPGTSFVSDNNFASFLSKIQSDQTEMLKQVSYLIVFGTFAPYGELKSVTTSVVNLGVNTISQKVTNEINKAIGNLLFKLTGDKSLQFDISTSTYSSSSFFGSVSNNGNSKLDRQRINLKFTQSTLNDKVIFVVGTDIDFNFGNTAVAGTGNFQWLPDVSVQFVLTRDRKLRAIVFNKSALDISSQNAIGRTNRQGISLSYSRDFEKLFGKKERVPKVNTKSEAKSN